MTQKKLLPHILHKLNYFVKHLYVIKSKIKSIPLQFNRYSHGSFYV